MLMSAGRGDFTRGPENESLLRPTFILQPLLKSSALAYIENSSQFSALPYD